MIKLKRVRKRLITPMRGGYWYHLYTLKPDSDRAVEYMEFYRVAQNLAHTLESVGFSRVDCIYNDGRYTYSIDYVHQIMYVAIVCYDEKDLQDNHTR